MYELLSEMSWRQVNLSGWWGTEHFWLITDRSRLWIFLNGSLSLLLEGCSSIYVFIHSYMSTNHFTFWDRYGVRDPLAGRAWQLLGESVYSSTRRWGVGREIWHVNVWQKLSLLFQFNLIDVISTFSLGTFMARGWLWDHQSWESGNTWCVLL